MRVSRLGGRGSDDGSHDHQRRLVGDRLRFVEACFERIEVLADLTEFENMPAVGAKACGGVVAEGKTCLAVDGDAVVVVDDDELPRGRGDQQATPLRD